MTGVPSARIPRRCGEAAFADTAPLSLDSIVAFTSLALAMAHLLRLYVRKFQPILAIGVMRAALLPELRAR